MSVLIAYCLLLIAYCLLLMYIEKHSSENVKITNTAAHPRLRVVEVHRLCPSRTSKGKSHKQKLQERITAAVNSVTPDMLQRVWSEIDYRIDVCRVTRGGHIECV
jgi:hypothetical protein